MQIEDTFIGSIYEAFFIVVICAIGGIINHITENTTLAIIVPIMLYSCIKILMFLD